MIRKLLGMSGAVLVITALLAGPVGAATVIVDFESLETTAPELEVAAPYNEDGFEFTSNIDPDLFMNHFSVWGTGNTNQIDTTALFSTYEGAIITFNRIDDLPFTLQTMQVGPLLNDPDPFFLEGNVSFEGVKSNGDIVTRTFALSGNFAFTLLDFGADPQNGGSFDDLVRVSYTDVYPPSFQLDNIQAEVVPEPSTALLALAGLAMLGLWRTQISRKALQRVRSA